MIHLCMWAKHFVIKLNMNRNINKPWYHTNCSGLKIPDFALMFLLPGWFDFLWFPLKLQQWISPQGSEYYFLMLSLSVLAVCKVRLHPLLPLLHWKTLFFFICYQNFNLSSASELSLKNNSALHWNYSSDSFFHFNNKHH